MLTLKMMNKIYTLCIAIALVGLGNNLSAQFGLRNTGAHIYVSQDATLMVQGTQGDFTNASANGTPGTIDLQGSLYLQGDWTNNASTGSLLWDASGTVVFNGSNQQRIRGNRTTSFQTVMLNEDVVVQTPYTLGSVLDLRQGRMFLGENDLRLGANSSITNYDASHYVVCNDTGALILQLTAGQSAKLFPIGTEASYNPISLQQASGASSGEFRVYVNHGIKSNGYTGSEISDKNSCVDKTWYISSDLSQINLTISAQWNASDEKNGFMRNACYISHFHDGAWDQQSTSSASGSGPYTQTRTGITSLSPFAVAGENGGDPLPIELLAFNGELIKNNSRLTWTTASEHNNYGFVIERSENAIDFDSINFMPAKYNNQSGGDYELFDYNAFSEEKSQILYYRLLQLDYGGSYSFSNIISLRKNTLEHNELLVWPNPAKDIIHIKLGDNKINSCQVYDMQGNLVLYPKGKTLHKLDISGLENGSYLLVCFAGEVYRKIFVVQH
jgi:hypothetical protein